MYPDHVLGVDAAELGRDVRAGIVAVGPIFVVAEPAHQFGPRVRGAVPVPALVRGRPGESEAGQ
jgi:hypothetical protein